MKFSRSEKKSPRSSSASQTPLPPYHEVSFRLTQFSVLLNFQKSVIQRKANPSPTLTQLRPGFDQVKDWRKWEAGKQFLFCLHVVGLRTTLLTKYVDRIGALLQSVLFTNKSSQNRREHKHKRIQKAREQKVVFEGLKQEKKRDPFHWERLQRNTKTSWPNIDETNSAGITRNLQRTNPPVTPRTRPLWSLSYLWNRRHCRKRRWKCWNLVALIYVRLCPRCHSSSSSARSSSSSSSRWRCWRYHCGDHRTVGQNQVILRHQ